MGKPKPCISDSAASASTNGKMCLKTAKGDIEKEIMAVRFDDTEPLEPVERDAFQAILIRHGTKTNLEFSRPNQS